MTDEELSHYGVLGMKWGQRQKANAAQIRSARSNVDRLAKGVSKQRDAVRKAPTASARKVQQKRLDKMDAAYLKNPDRVIAARMTRGEKFITLIGGGIILPGAGILPGAAIIAGTSARSRAIEKKQEEGAYDKKK